MGNETQLMTHIEELLHKDVTGEQRKSLVNAFQQKGSEIQKILNRGCKPDEYRKLAALKEGLVSAEVIIEKASKQLLT